MGKLYDFDGMFDERLSKYITEYGTKYKESEWEEVIPELYNKFGDTVVRAIGKTPREYYAGMSDDELVKTLRAHIKQSVPVSEFLCEAIENRDGCVELMLPLLDGSEDEMTYAIGILGSDDAAVPKYIDIISGTGNDDLKEMCTDYVKNKADLVKDRALALYRDGVECERMMEILSRVTERDEDVFDMLLTAFRTDPDNIPMHASYLAVYGDERALPYLLDTISEEGITYPEYQELKIAIETLGGRYDVERDFSDDPYYQTIKAHSASETDIFSAFEEGEGDEE
ncbi:MAG: hypothetical protein LUD29_06200 [Clostridia bacterium]|nr:hypothetical protein [Clostridia bacterium]